MREDSGKSDFWVHITGKYWGDSVVLEKISDGDGRFERELHAF